MKKALRITSVLLATFVLAGALVGCNNQGNASSTTSGGSASTSDVGGGLTGVQNELALKLEGEIDDSKVLTTLINTEASPAFHGNPYDETAGMSWSAQPLVYDYLAFFTPFPERSFRPNLVESYTFEDKVLEMKLQSGAKWSDGSELNANDVLTTLYCTVGRGPLWQYVESVELVDDLTIRFKVTTDSELILNLAFQSPVMASTAQYSKWADQYKVVVETQRKFNEELNIYEYTAEAQTTCAAIFEDLLSFKPTPEEMLSSGPYVITNWNTSEVMFEANPQFRKEVLIKKIRGLQPGDSQAFATSLLAGEYTIENGGLSADMSAQVDKKYADTMRKYFVPELNQIGYNFNVEKYPLNLPEVRKAISMFVDKDILAAISEPGSFPGDSKNSGVITTLQDAYVSDSFVDGLVDYSLDIEAATALLESIGWTKDGNKWLDDKGEWIPITIATISTWPTFMMSGEAMSSMLTDAGFNIDFRPMEFGVWNAFCRDDEERMIFCNFAASATSFAHPWEGFNMFYNTAPRSSFTPGLLPAGVNRTVTVPSTGEEVDITSKVLQLYSATGDEATKLIEELMTITNDLCAFMSAVEKTAPYRIYDTKLSLADGELNAVQQNYYYFGNLNTILLKLMLDDQLYFVK